MPMFRRSYDFLKESSAPPVEVAKSMSSMKQLAAQVLRGEEVARIHALTSASFPDAGHALGESWDKQARRSARTVEQPAVWQGSQIGSKPDVAPHERWPDLTICRDFSFGTVKAVLRGRLAPECGILLCVDEMPLNVRMVHRVILASVDAVLVHSDALARAIHMFGVPASRIVLSSSRNDFVAFDRPVQLRTDGDLRQIVHVGDLEPEAGVADFLLCVAAWAERNPRRRVAIHWCGEGCLRGVLEAQPLPFNVQQVFLGRIARKELATTFLDCDILALPALADPWDNVVPEALAAQLPVLGSAQVRAVADLIVPGMTGWVFDPFESGAMARAVELALNTVPDELDRMRACAAERPKPSLPGLNERIWRAMRLEGVGPDLDPALLGLAC